MKPKRQMKNMQRQVELATATEDLSEISYCIDLHKSLINDWVYRRTSEPTSLSTETQLVVKSSTLEALRSETLCIKAIIRAIESENRIGVETLVRTEENTSLLDRDEEVRLSNLHHNIEATMAKLMGKEAEIQKLEEQCKTLDGVAATLAFNRGEVSVDHEIICLTKMLRRVYRLSMISRSRLQQSAKKLAVELKLRNRRRRRTYKQVKVSLGNLPDPQTQLPEREAIDDLFGIYLNGPMDSSDDENPHVINLQPSVDKIDEVIVHKDLQTAYEVALLERISIEEEKALKRQLTELRIQHKRMLESLAKGSSFIV